MLIKQIAVGEYIWNWKSDLCIFEFLTSCRILNPLSHPWGWGLFKPSFLSVVQPRYILSRQSDEWNNCGSGEQGKDRGQARFLTLFKCYCAAENKNWLQGRYPPKSHMRWGKGKHPVCALLSNGITLSLRKWILGGLSFGKEPALEAARILQHLHLMCCQGWQLKS